MQKVKSAHFKNPGRFRAPRLKEVEMKRYEKGSRTLVSFGSAALIVAAIVFLTTSVIRGKNIEVMTGGKIVPDGQLT